MPKRKSQHRNLLPVRAYLFPHQVSIIKHFANHDSRTVSCYLRHLIRMHIKEREERDEF